MDEDSTHSEEDEFVANSSAAPTLLPWHPDRDNDLDMTEHPDSGIIRERPESPDEVEKRREPDHNHKPGAGRLQNRVGGGLEQFPKRENT